LTSATTSPPTRPDRPALDLTGLTGNFDYVVNLSGLGNKPGSSGYDGNRGSVFQAIQEVPSRDSH